jgi:hypothetical protein
MLFEASNTNNIRVGPSSDDGFKSKVIVACAEINPGMSNITKNQKRLYFERGDTK